MAYRCPPWASPSALSGCAAFCWSRATRSPYGKDTDFPAVLSKAAALREQYNVTVLPQGKKLGKQLGQLEAAGFAGAAFMDKDEVKIFAQQ